jgi:molybdopterin-containing oxidoreductase family iron-sulfur binding subunit
MPKLSRRGFLKALGLSGTAAITGCSPESSRKLIPYIIPPEDIVPGEATWYATTCRECPAGCGLLAKNRDGHIIKVEGNPLHPVNQGKLCARGQASVQGLYNPDRIKGPLKKNSQGEWENVSWEDGENILIEKVSGILQKGRGERIVFLTDLISGTLKDLIVLWLSQMGSRDHLQYEPFSYESLRKAN